MEDVKEEEGSNIEGEEGIADKSSKVSLFSCDGSACSTQLDNVAAVTVIPKMTCTT